jgi:hypothetical protein
MQGQGFLTQFIRQLSQLFSRVVSSDQAAPRVILSSPDGKAWDVTVSDAGALVVTHNTGQINPEGGHPP